MAQLFARFVRSVEGRLVSRWDTGPSQYFGARLGSPEERAAGKAVVWDTDAVIPLTEEFCIRFSRELARALREGDLEAATPEAYDAWIKTEAARDEAAEAEREAARKASQPKVDAPKPPAAVPLAAPDQPPEAQPAADAKSEKRK